MEQTHGAAHEQGTVLVGTHARDHGRIELHVVEACLEQPWDLPQPFARMLDTDTGTRGAQLPAQLTQQIEMLDSGALSHFQPDQSGRLPGDFKFKLFGRDWFIPLASTVLLSFVVSLIAKWV